MKLHSLLKLLRQWNIQVPCQVCCALHAHIHECQNSLLMLKKRVVCENPDRFASRMGDYPCGRCGMVNFDDGTSEKACSWCRSLKDQDLLPGAAANLGQKR